MSQIKQHVAQYKKRINFYVIHLNCMFKKKSKYGH